MPQPGLYEHVLGDAWPRLAPAIRSLHCGDARRVGEGTFDVSCGSTLLARVMNRVVRAPKSGRCTIRLDVTADGAMRETWTRYFGGDRFVSRQFAKGSLLAERIGPALFLFELVEDAGRLRFVQRRARLLGIPVPAFLAPVIRATVTADGDDSIDVDVAMSARWSGTILHYCGNIRRTS